MTRRRRRKEQAADPAAAAAIAGGAVTRERLAAAARREGAQSPRLKALLAQSPPPAADLARAYTNKGGVPFLDGAQVALAPEAARILDPALLRRHRCVPVELFEDFCVLAVLRDGAEAAVRAVRAVLQRDVLPVIAPAAALDAALAHCDGARRARRLPPRHRKDSPIHARFRGIALDQCERDAVRLPEERA